MGLLQGGNTMTKFQLTEFLTWMTNHQPSSKQVMDEMYVHDVVLVMQTVRDEFTRLQAERDEISIHADVIIKEASALITRCVESRKASAYWNAVEQFRQFESRTT
jgi:predicted ATP-dependent protease